jgi:hypothetical protein
MSQRTFCDRCGRECSGHRRSVVHLTELHYAKADRSSPAAEDDYRPADLCDVCTDVVKEMLGGALRPGHRHDNIPGEDAWTPGAWTMEARAEPPEQPVLSQQRQEIVDARARQADYGIP